MKVNNVVYELRRTNFAAILEEVKVEYSIPMNIIMRLYTPRTFITHLNFHIPQKKKVAYKIGANGL